VYTHALVKSVLFHCRYHKDNEYSTFQDMSTQLNKMDHKISFVGVRENVGSTTYYDERTPIRDSLDHSFGVPRYFFRLNLTSALYEKPYSYVHWARFKAIRSHRTCFEGAFSQNEWQTGPVERDNINPFCLLEDIIPSRFVLGFDDTCMDMYFMALDPERVGLENVENGKVCDFGDNVLDYETNGGRTVESDISDSDGSDNEGGAADAVSDDGTMSDEVSADEGGDDDDDDVMTDLLSTNFVKFLKP
jgi:hypothetical protein